MIRFFDRIALANGTASMLHLCKNEIEKLVHDRVEQILKNRANFVTRDEFEAVKMMAENAMAENQDLKQKFAAFEKQFDKKPKKK